MASFPDSVFAPANRSNGQTIDASHVNNAQDEIVAIEGGYLNGTARLNSSNSTLASLSVTGNSTLASSITVGSLPYVFPSSGGSTGQVLTIVSTSGSTMGLEWRAGASSAATDGFTVSTGVLTLNQGQVSFPATQVASAGVNTLDDYEEGTWTPSDQSGAALSFTGTNGNYVKVGQLVIAEGELTYPTTADGSNARIGGLPFTGINSGSASGAASIGYTDYGSAINMYVIANTTNMDIYAFTTARLTNANLSAKTIWFTVMYRATA